MEGNRRLNEISRQAAERAAKSGGTPGTAPTPKEVDDDFIDRQFDALLMKGRETGTPFNIKSRRVAMKGR